MRRSLGPAVVALVASASPVRADDPRDLFGAPKRDEPALDCSDGLDFGCAIATDPFADASPFGLRSIIDRARLADLPLADARHDAVVSHALGAATDVGGTYFAGATNLDNRWLIGGAAAESIRFGGVGLRVPLQFLDRITVTAGGFDASDRAGLGGVVDVDLYKRMRTRDDKVWRADGEVWVGARLLRDDLPRLPATYFPAIADPIDPRTISATLLVDSPLFLLPSSWKQGYVAGIQARVSSNPLTRTSQRLVDRDGDGQPDTEGTHVLTTETVDRQDRSTLSRDFAVFGGYAVEHEHHAFDVGVLLNSFGDQRIVINATESAAGISRAGTTLLPTIAWTGRWSRTRARVTASWFRSSYSETPWRDGDDGVVQLQSAYVPASLPGDDVLAAACDDTAGDDAYPGIPNCPLPTGFFLSGGAGLMFAEDADRPAIVGDVAHRLGDHVVRTGVSFEDTRLITRRRYTGGALVRSLFEGHTDTLRFAERSSDSAIVCDDMTGATCFELDESAIRFRTRSLAVHVGDSWRPLDGLVIDGGVRWESMEVGDAIRFRDQLAPRVGAAWDFLGGGRSRVFAGAGRTYAILPAGFGETVLDGPTQLRTIEFPGIDPVHFLVDDTAVPVDGDVEPMYADEVVAGVEVAAAGAVRATLWGQARFLRRGLETEDGRVDNPGRLDGPVARRTSTVVAAELATAPGKTLSLRVQYAYGRSHGSFAGAFEPRLGAILYAGPDWDGPPGADNNLLGHLPSDFCQRITVEAAIRGRIGPLPVVAGTRGVIASGAPVSILARSPDLDVYHLVPRGTAGRLAHSSVIDLRIAADIGPVDIVLDAINVFARQAATAVGEQMFVDVDPIDGAELGDLPFVKQPDGTPATRDPRYGIATRLGPPLTLAIGVRGRL